MDSHVWQPIVHHEFLFRLLKESSFEREDGQEIPLSIWSGMQHAELLPNTVS